MDEVFGRHNVENSWVINGGGLVWIRTDHLKPRSDAL